MGNSNSNKLILKNTLYLYMRMILVMAISLYTSRIVLDVLGVEDYGLYNVIAGVIILLSILNNSMISATQRFLTFEIGKGDEEQVAKTFSMSMTAHIGIGVLLLLIGETIGLWYVNNYLSIPLNREAAAMWAYQMSLVIMFVTIIRSPYNAAIISYEHMSFFAIISVMESVFKLGIVFVLQAFAFDKLIFYALLMCVVEIILTLSYRAYSRHHFRVCHFKFYIDKLYFKDLMGFLGWNVVGGLSTLGTQQVGNLIVNAFYGVAVNAAFGIAYQVSNAVNQFVTNFQTAFRPQIVKLYSQNEMTKFFLLIKRASLMSFYLLLVVSFPIYVNIDFVLGIWLKQVPEYTGILCQLLIINALLDAIQAPIWAGVYATGHIRSYQIWTSALFFLNIPISYIFLRQGLAPYWVLIVRVAIVGILSVYRCFHARNLYKLPLAEYLTEVILRALLSTFVIWMIWTFAKSYMQLDSLLDFIIIYIETAGISSLIIIGIGINKYDRKFIIKLATEKASTLKNKVL